MKREGGRAGNAPIRPDACPQDVVGVDGTVHVHVGGARTSAALSAGAACIERGQSVHEVGA